MKRRWFKFLGPMLGLVVAVSLFLVSVSPAVGATPSQVTVSATGSYVSYTANQTTYNFGTVASSSTTNTSGNWILFTNTSSVSTNISVQMLAATWTSAGTGWTHSDTAAGANTTAMKANSSNATTWATSVFVKFNAPYSEIATSVAAAASIISGLSLLAPTSFPDGNTNNNTVQFNYYSS